MFQIYKESPIQGGIFKKTLIVDTSAETFSGVPWNLEHASYMLRVLIILILRLKKEYPSREQNKSDGPAYIQHDSNIHNKKTTSVF